MSNNEYSRSFTNGAVAHMEGETLVFDGKRTSMVEP